MPRYRCAILDDYQDVVLKAADWSKVSGDLAKTTIEKADYFFARLRPNVFAYQHLFEIGRSTKSESPIDA